MKHRLILRSLADVPANALSFAASAPGNVMQATKEMLGPPARATRRQFSAARLRPRGFLAAIRSRSLAAAGSIQPWSRGGINE